MRKTSLLGFFRPCKRNDLLQNSKKKTIAAKDLAFPVPDSVYLNEHLTRQNKQLLGAAMTKEKEVNWRYVWTTGGIVLVRRDESAGVTQIRSPTDLDKMTA